MVPFGTILIVVAVAFVLALVAARAEGLSFLLPRTSRGLSVSAQGFCSGRCRSPSGRCPLSGSSSPSATCPLWKYVDADLQTVEHGSPFSLV